MASTMAVSPGAQVDLVAVPSIDIQIIEDLNFTNYKTETIQKDLLNEWSLKNGHGNNSNPSNSLINDNDLHNEDNADDTDDLELLEEMSAVNPSKNAEFCCLCKNILSSPRILNCLHVFCENCINTQLIDDDGAEGIGPFVITCPICDQITEVGTKGAASLACDYVITNILDMSAIENMTVLCTSCKGAANAVARCSDCANFLCPNCNTAHQFMRCFENHKVIGFEELKGSWTTVPIHKPIFCTFHSTETIKFYCYTCQQPVCNECLLVQHKAPDHQCGRLSDAEFREKRELLNLMSTSKSKMSECESASSQLENALSELQSQRDQAKDLITDTAMSYEAILEKCRDNAMRELQKLHSERELQVMDTFHNIEKTVEKIEDANRFTSRLLEQGDTAEILSLKPIVAKQLMNLIDNTPTLSGKLSFEFQTDDDYFEKVMRESFGKLKTESTKEFEVDAVLMPSGIASNRKSGRENGYVPLQHPQLHQAQMPLAGLMSAAFSSTGPVNNFQVLPKLGTLGTLGNQEMGNLVPAPMILGSVLSPRINGGQNNGDLSATLRLNGGYQSMTSSTSPILSLGDDPKGSIHSTMGGRSNGGTESGSYGNPRSGSNGKQAPMQIRCKFGQLGSSQGQFNSPHGFCLGCDEDIVVADTNNHRVQIFDKTGQFKSQFGIAGKEEGQLWYPRKVAVMRKCGKFVVCDRGNERSRMQIFTKHGHFIKRIAIRYIDIVAGLAVNNRGQIVAVDSVSPTVFVIDDNGNLLSWFDCSEYMREPSDIAINGKEFFVCDFKGHCVVVFNEEGHFLRRVGCENITNFPNGIDISDAGDILIGDSHGNRFHLAVFSRDGSLLSEFDCPYVKVSRCCGLKITSEGYIVTLAKNNHHVLILNTLYIL